MPQKPRLSKNYSLMNRRKIRKAEPLWCQSKSSAGWIEAGGRELYQLGRRASLGSAAENRILMLRDGFPPNYPRNGRNPSTNHSGTIERKFICAKNTKKVLSFWVLHSKLFQIYISFSVQSLLYSYGNQVTFQNSEHSDISIWESMLQAVYVDDKFELLVTDFYQ